MVTRCITIEATRNITASRHVAKSRYDWANAFALSCFPILAVLTLGLGLPRLAEGIFALSGNAALEEIRIRPTAQAYGSLIASRERTIGWVDRGISRSQLAAALIYNPVEFSTDERRSDVSRALDEAKLAVAESPADAFAWHHLAQASYALDGASQAVVDAELSSIAIGPYETELLAPRLDLIFAARSFLDQKSDDTIDDQIRILWIREREKLVLAIRRNGAADIVRRALGRPPVLFKEEYLNSLLQDPKIR